MQHVANSRLFTLSGSLVMELANDLELEWCRRRELISKFPLGVGHLAFNFPPLLHPPPTREGGA